MDDVKERVRRELERIEPSPNALQDTLRRVRRHELRRRLAVGVLALVVAAGGVVFAAQAFWRGESPRPASPTGASLIAFSVENDIYVMNPDGTGVTNLTGTEGVSELSPAWSPDGRRIAFVACTECTTSDIYAMDADGMNVTQLTDDPALNGPPVWFPDGGRVAYGSDATGRWSEDQGWIPGKLEMWMVKADGTEKRRWASWPEGAESFSWSPDGGRLAFHRTHGQDSSGIYLVNADGTGERRLTDPSLWAEGPVWSPNGSVIAFNVYEGHTWLVYVMGPDGSDIRRVSDESGLIYSWSPDGSALLIGRLETHDNLYVLDIETGEETRVFRASRPEREGVRIDGAAWRPSP